MPTPAVLYVSNEKSYFYKIPSVKRAPVICSHVSHLVQEDKMTHSVDTIGAKAFRL